MTFEFGAAHSAPCCVRPDGHLWIIEATVETNDRGFDPRILVEGVHQVADELNGANLNEMMPGVTTSPEGIGAYIHERLLQYAQVVAITVDMRPGYRAELEWPRR